MSRFIAVDRDTAYLLPPSVDEWLPQDHLARFVVEVIDQLDLSELVRQYAGRGSDAYHPAMLLGLLVYGYASGVHSSRKIERACHDSVAFRFIAANTQPDHDSIATFRRRFLPQIETLFVQVLVLAREMKCLKLGNIALDGTKIAANASKHRALSWEHANRIEAQLREEVQLLLKLAEDSDSRPVNDGLDVAGGDRAARASAWRAIAQAKTKIEQRARERHAVEQQDYEAKCAKRQAQREAGQEAARDRAAAAVERAQGRRPSQPHRRRVAHHAHLARGLRAKLQRPGRSRYPDHAGGDRARLAGAQRQA